MAQQSLSPLSVAGVTLCSACAPLFALSGVTLTAAQLHRLRSRSTLLLSLSEAWAAQAARCSVSAPLIAQSDVTLAAAAASATLSINAAALAIGSLGGTGRSLLGVCTADRLVGYDARRRRCVGNALDKLSINAAALALGSLSCIGLSPLGMCTADRRVGCDARRRSCVGNTFDPRCFSRSRNLGRHRPLAARCLHRCSPCRV